MIYICMIVNKTQNIILNTPIIMRVALGFPCVGWPKHETTEIFFVQLKYKKLEFPGSDMIIIHLQREGEGAEREW